MRSRNIPILSTSQALANCGPPIVVLLGGLIGTELAPSPALATLPVSILIVGVAVFTIPAAFFMQRVGRRRGFMFASFVALCASLLAAYAIHLGNFALFCLATMFIGANGAFVQQYRFAAAESVEPQYAARAVSFVLIGGIVAGFLGPEIAKRTQDWFSFGLYTGPFVSLAFLYVGVIVLMSFLKKIVPPQAEIDGPARPFKEVVFQPMYLTAVSASVVAYGVMSFIMTATPVHLHTHNSYSLDQTAWVIQSHIIAMYLPSLFTGILLERFGLLRIMLAGVASMLICVVMAVTSQNLPGYWGALVLLGVGWNFLFVGGTVLLTRTYLPRERFKAQAANDFMIFGSQALASLSAGTVLHYASWDLLNLITLPFLVLILSVVLIMRRKIALAPGEA